MRIADNNCNNRTDADSNRIARIRLSKSDSRILRMQILLITASAFVFSLVVLYKSLLNSITLIRIFSYTHYSYSSLFCYVILLILLMYHIYQLI
jgi:hypothetical protein